MRSALDEAIALELVALPQSVAPDEEASVILKRAAEIASRLAISAAFQERLTSSDAAAIGCADGGRLSRAGRRLAALQIEDYVRSESRCETIVRTRARIHSACLLWSFTSDECSAVFALRLAASAGGADVDLINVHARRIEGVQQIAAQVMANSAAINSFDRRLLRSGLDAASLCHCLIGMV